MKKSLLLFALFLPLAVYAEAYKCRDENGRLIFTDGGCPKGTTTERVQGKDVISPGEKAQTEELNARTQRLLEQLQKEKSERKKKEDEKNAPAEKNPPEAPPPKADEAKKPDVKDAPAPGSAPPSSRTAIIPGAS